MAPSRPRVLQYGKMPLPQLDAELAQAYDVSILSEQADPERFLAQQGVQTLAAQDPIASKILAP